MLGLWPALLIAVLAAFVLLGVLPGSQVAWIIVLILALVGGALAGFPYWGSRTRV
ncbi:MAG TPA: hypothetical protein VEQ15_00290 [Myxococcales bacterium]|nr:hypothetical protein [Myxococcales bacterium]